MKSIKSTASRFAVLALLVIADVPPLAPSGCQQRQVAPVTAPAARI